MRLNRALIKSFLPIRPKHSHKGTFGRVLIIAGCEKMTGAAVLCARATLQVGAGLVALALPKSSQCIAVSALPEMLTLPLPEENGILSKRALPQINQFIQEFNPSVILIGPGLSKSELIVEFLKTCRIPCVIDADGLNALSALAAFPSLPMPCICTPHPGEMARLLDKPVSPDQAQRENYAKKLSAQTKGVTVLKGFETVITDGETIYINPTGGPALAKAGSGDVLAGYISGLWAQLAAQEGLNNNSALKAAACGVYLHGLCGDLASKILTDYCVLASDLLSQLPNAFKEVLDNE